MYSLSNLDVEIEAKIDQLENAFPDQDVEANWIAQAVLSDHPLSEQADPDGFHHVLTAKTVRERVRRFVQRYDGAPSIQPDKQMVLEGFERLQTHYLIERQGAQKLVRVDRMTKLERRRKSDELRLMGAGCYQHADELDRYNDSMLAA